MEQWSIDWAWYDEIIDEAKEDLLGLIYWCDID